MAAHCPYCNSTNITPMVTPPPKNISYFHCDECNRNFITPVYDPQAVAVDPADAPVSEEPA